MESVVIDIPNGYLSISGVNFSKPFTLTFVYFDRQGKSDVPAYSYSEHGAEKNDHFYGFYELDNDGVWKDLEDTLLPKLRLSDLDTGPKKLEDQYPDVRWEYILPQKGTTVLAIPQMTEEMTSSGFKGTMYQMVQAFSARSIELLWDRNQGLFTKGAVR